MVLFLTASNIRDIPHTLVAVARIRLGAVAAARMRRFVGVVVACIRCFGEDIVAAVAFAAAGAVRTVVGADIAVAASAVAEAGCTAAFAAEAGRTDLHVSAHGCWKLRCWGGFVHHRLVLPSVVGPREPVGFLRGRVSVERGWATKS